MICKEENVCFKCQVSVTGWPGGGERFILLQIRCNGYKLMVLS